MYFPGKVFQRRMDGSIDFARSWAQYKKGFGDLVGEFWLGNEKMHLLTQDGNYELRVDLEDWDGVWKYALYGNFSIKSEADDYMLITGTYVNGTAGMTKEHEYAVQRKYTYF